MDEQKNTPMAEAQQGLESLLCSEERDFLIRNNGDQVAVSELVGKIVCLYFSAHWCPPCRGFTPELIQFYNELRRRGEEFEIVFISSDRDEASFQKYFGSMPWVALPFGDKTGKNLSRHFQIKGIPTLIVLGPGGKTLQTEGVELIMEYGISIYPFTKERLDELKAQDEARRAAQTLESLLIAEERDFVITHGGGRVAVSELVGKTVCLYFSAHWCPPCRGFTPELIQFYNELKTRGEEFEIVFISRDRDEASFEEYFGSMPWVALPFGDKTGKDLSRYFQIKGIPSLIVLGPDGKTLQTEGVELIMENGGSIYPFTKERFDELKAQDEARRAEQTLESLLIHEERNFVITHGGGRVAVSELVGKTVCLYFSAHWWPPCRGFTPELIQFYNELKKRGEELEIVFISRDRDEASFQEYFGSMPWVALPFGDRTGKDLSRYFQIEGIPTLIVLGPDGKTLQTEGVELIMEHGVSIYPFTRERLDELKAQDEARRAAQTLESLLISEERDFVITHDSGRVPVSQLTGKTVGLYFSAHWCPPCREFTPMLAQVYTELKQGKKAFEIVFLSSDRDQAAFEEYYTTMPWLALPFGDKVKKDLSRYFYVEGIPTLIIIGPDGKTVTTDGTSIVSVHGAKAYPFTEARLAELQKEMEEKANEASNEENKAAGIICEGDVCRKV